MLKILITGGGGYTGSVLAQKLLNCGYSLTILDLFVYGNFLQKHRNINFVQGDVCDEELIKKITPGHDIVIHLAFICDHSRILSLQEIKDKTNTFGLKNVANCARKIGVSKFVFPSSTSIYGTSNSPLVTEETSPQPLSDYAKYKMEGEQFLKELADSNFCITILRPSTVSGISPRLRLDLLLNFLVANAFYHNKIPVKGKNRIRPTINVRDLSEIYLQVIESPQDKVNNQIFNAGFENLSIFEIANKVKKKLDGNPEIEVQKTEDKRSYAICTKKLLSTFNFSPLNTLDITIEELIGHFKKNSSQNLYLHKSHFNRDVEFA